MGISGDRFPPQSADVQEFEYPPPALLLVFAYFMDVERLAQDILNRHPWVERRIGILEDDLHIPSELAKGFAIEMRDVLPLEKNLPACGLDEP